MSFRLLLAATLVPALSTAAFAQGAPGDCEDCYVVAPTPIAVAADPALSHRLGVGLHVASLAIADRNDPEADPTQLGGGGIQVRYRLTRRWELELGVTTLQQHDADHMATGPQVHAGTIGASFHMRPGHRWDWYLLGAVGGIHEGDRHATADHQGRAMGQLGIGLERRWRHLDLGIELRAVGIAPAQTDSTQQPPAEAQPGTAAARTAAPTPTTDERGDSGAQLSFAATYYF